MGLKAKFWLAVSHTKLLLTLLFFTPIIVKTFEQKEIIL